MKKLILALAAALLFGSLANAQRPVKTDTNSVHEKAYEKYPNQKKNGKMPQDSTRKPLSKPPKPLDSLNMNSTVPPPAYKSPIGKDSTKRFGSDEDPKKK